MRGKRISERIEGERGATLKLMQKRGGARTQGR